MGAKEEWIFFIVVVIHNFYTHSPAGADEKNQNHKGWNYYDVYIEMQQQKLYLKQNTEEGRQQQKSMASKYDFFSYSLLMYGNSVTSN